MHVSAVIARVAVACSLAFPVRAQAVFAELEPNNSKSAANPVVCLLPGDAISGVSAGTSTSAGDTTANSVDYFRIRTCTLVPGIYRHRLTLTTSGAAGHIVTILGLDAVDLPPPTITSTETALQNSSPFTTPPRFVQWYGFGRSEELFARVSGISSTTAPYALTLTTDPVFPAAIPTVLHAGQITITTEGQGHSTDTELKVYDATWHPIAGFANDDTPLALPGGGSQFQSTLQRTIAPGTYFLLLSRFNMADNLLAGADDAYQFGDVLDFPDLVLGSDTTIGSNVSFAVTDLAGTTAIAALLPPEPYTILWYQLTVGPAWSVAPFCFGDASGFGCPCANNGLFGRGCASSVNAFGAQLASAGIPSLTADSFALLGSGMPNGFVLYFQGTGAAQAWFGDGIMCVGGSITRLGLEANVGGTSQYPSGPDPLISTQGMPLAGAPYRYQGWYRDSAPFCTAATFNLTNALTVFWAP